MSTIIENYKITKTEEELETKFFHQLENLGFTRAPITNEKQLKENLKVQLEIFNREVLKSLNKTEFSNSEFAKIWNHLDKGSTYDKALKLRDRYPLKFDNGISKNVRFFNSKIWCQNEYQVTRQLVIERARKHRYDVVLLINGLPLVFIELKNNGHKLKEGWEDIKRYRRFTIKGSIMNYTQVFIVSNGVDTIYFANNDQQEYKQVITWADAENNKINSLHEFTDTFLEKCAVSKVIAKNVILENVSKKLMIMRPYQIHAYEKMIEKVNTSNTGGTIWHTTGSGKTLTSFVASRDISKLQNVYKTIFVVDRVSLDGQIQEKFNSFEEDCVSPSHNTKNLLLNLNDPNKKFIITTMQKMNYLLTKEDFKKNLKPFGNKKIVMVFDECHRSTFGKAFQLIKREFNNPQMFGFTGTPIFEENKKGDDSTTKSLFSETLHKYNIKSAIIDNKVLGFSVISRGKFYSTVKSENDLKDVVSDVIEREEQYLNDKRIGNVAKDIIEQYSVVTNKRDYCSMFAVNSIPMLIKYASAFDKIKKDIRIAYIFSFDPTEPEVSYEENGDIKMLDVEISSYREFMEGKLLEYNATFQTNYTINDMKGYRRDVQRRHIDKTKELTLRDENIDMIVVVGMLLTGYDNEKINTLFLDKTLRYQGLIQAFSRTNRITNNSKPHGNIITYRPLKENIKKAMLLYGDNDPQNKLLKKSYQAYLAEMKEAAKNVRSVVKTEKDFDTIESSRENLIKFVVNFRKMNHLKVRMVTFLDFKYENFGFTKDEWKIYVTKYMNLGENYEGGKIPIQSTEGFIDFDMEGFATEQVDIDYLNEQITSVVNHTQVDPFKAQKQADKLAEKVLNDPKFRDRREIMESFMKKLNLYIAYLNGEVVINSENNVSIEFFENDVKGQNKIPIFELYRDIQKEEEIKNKCKDLKLNKNIIHNIISDSIYSGDDPRPSKIRTAFLEDNLKFLEQVQKEKETLKMIRNVKNKYVWE